MSLNMHKTLLRYMCVTYPKVRKDGSVLCTLKSQNVPVELSPSAAVPLSSVECFSIFQLIFLVHSHWSYQTCFQQAADFSVKALLNPLYTACPPNGS